MGQKNLCDLVKSDYLSNNFDDYVKMVKKGKYLCQKCGRTAKDKNYICKPEKLSKKK